MNDKLKKAAICTCYMCTLICMLKVHDKKVAKDAYKKGYYDAGAVYDEQLLSLKKDYLALHDKIYKNESK